MPSSLNGTGVTFSNGSSQSIAWPGISSQVFTSSGTFTVPAGVTSLKITVVGGGGGSSLTYGGHGGIGGCAQGVYTVTPGASYTVTIGNGGASVSSGTGAGSGGTSSFGALISATGGGARTGSTQPAYGTGSGGTIYNSYGVSNQQTFYADYWLVGFQGYWKRHNGSSSSFAAVAWSPTLLGKVPNNTGNGYVDARLAPGATGFADGDPSTAAGGVGGAVLVEW